MLQATKMKKSNIVLIVISSIILVIGLSYGMGWYKVFYTKTVGKEQKNADREVYEETQSYVEGKRQEAAKYYREYNLSEEDEKKAISEVVANSFANFDEDKLNPELKDFVKKCKYGK